MPVRSIPLIPLTAAPSQKHTGQRLSLPTCPRLPIISSRGRSMQKVEVTLLEESSRTGNPTSLRRINPRKQRRPEGSKERTIAPRHPAGRQEPEVKRPWVRRPGGGELICPFNVTGALAELPIPSSTILYAAARYISPCLVLSLLDPSDHVVHYEIHHIHTLFT